MRLLTVPHARQNLVLLSGHRIVDFYATRMICMILPLSFPRQSHNPHQGRPDKSLLRCGLDIQVILFDSTITGS